MKENLKANDFWRNYKELLESTTDDHWKEVIDKVKTTSEDYQKELMNFWDK
jgi:hypothetical protein